MELTCPYCGQKGGLNDTHRHLVDRHGEQVLTEYDQEEGKMQYIIACPVCPLKYRHRIKPRYKNPDFLEEFKFEISLVAFDQLLYHLAKEHADVLGFDISQIEDEPGDADVFSAG